MTTLPFSRRTIAWTAALAVAAGALTWAIVRPIAEPNDESYHSGAATRAATVGHYYGTAEHSAPDAKRVVVVLPTSRVTVTIGAPTGHVDSAENDDLTEFTAPGNGSLVQVEYDDDPTVSTVPAATYSKSDAPVTLRLVADGKSYALTEGDEAAGNVVAVAGRHPNLSVAVSYAGVTQIVDLQTGKRSAGAAGPLYTALRSGSAACGTPTVTAPLRVDTAAAPVTCRVDDRRVPYVPTLGWARAGQSWLLTAVTATGPSVVVRPHTKGNGQVETDTLADRAVTCGSSHATFLSPKPLVPGENDDRRDGSDLFACAVPATGSVPVTITESLQIGSDPGQIELRWALTV